MNRIAGQRGLLVGAFIQCAPRWVRCWRNSGATRLSTTTDCSATHAVPLSNAFEVRIISAASARSCALAPTHAGTLPAPTAIVGLPLE